MSSINAPRFLASVGASAPYSISDETALALKMYWGSVVEAARSSTYIVGTPFINSKTVDSGKSWQFLMQADMPAPEGEYTPGDELVGQAFAFEEGTITVDKPIVAHHYVPRDQWLMAHWDVIGRLGPADGKRIARIMDGRAFVTLAMAARSAAVTKAGLTVHNGGNRLTRGGGSSTLATAMGAAYPRSPIGAQRFREDLRQLRYEMARDNVGADGLIPAWTTPYMFNVLQFDNGVVWTNTSTPTAGTVGTAGSTLWGSDYAAGNSLHRRLVAEIEGFRIMATPNTSGDGGPFPQGTVSNNPSKYTSDFTCSSSTGAPVLLACAPGNGGETAVGQVTFEGIQSVMDADVKQRMSAFLRSHVFTGFGVLHPWCAGSIEVTSGSDAVAATTATN